MIQLPILQVRLSPELDQLAVTIGDSQDNHTLYGPRRKAKALAYYRRVKQEVCASFRPLKEADHRDYFHVFCCASGQGESQPMSRPGVCQSCQLFTQEAPAFWAKSRQEVQGEQSCI